MSGICGWSGFSRNTHTDGDLLRRMATALPRFNGERVEVDLAAQWAIGCSTSHSSLALHADASLAVVICGKPLAHDAHTFFRMFRETGVGCLKQLSGGVALAIIDKQNGAVVLATDRMGITPIFYSVANNSIAFSSSLDTLNMHPLAGRLIDPQSLYDYVYFHVIPSPRTIYRGIERLMPGQYLLFQNGAATTKRYWQPRYEEHQDQPFSELKQEFLTLLRESVQRAAQGGNVGAFLSGGTDSSTISGLLGEVTGEPARTYSIGFDVHGYDEIDYARIAAQHFRTEHHEYYVTPSDVVAAIPKIAEVHDQPFGNSSAVPTYYCARLAKDDGIQTLLGGDGGDELFGGNERYAKQYLYSLYGDLPELIRKKLIEPFVFIPPEIGIAGRIQRYVRNASQPMPARYANYNLLNRLGPTAVFTAEFLREVDQELPLVQMAQYYDSVEADSMINRMLALDLKYTLADDDLPKVTRSCQLAGVGVRFPMLDDELVAFSTRLPPSRKLKGTQLRHFFKAALGDFLPDEIIAKKKHGFGLPFGLWLQTYKPLHELVGDALSDLKKRDIVQPAFIDTLMGEHLSTHPAYYGTMAWVLLMLEQWFSKKTCLTISQL